jgi:hypothetical protein
MTSFSPPLLAASANQIVPNVFSSVLYSALRVSGIELSEEEADPHEPAAAATAAVEVL